MSAPTDVPPLPSLLPMQDGCGQAPCVQTPGPRVQVPTPTPRSRHLDALRGLAVSLMVVDHLALFLGLLPLRLTVGRLAMPLFFILAGHLVHRYGWRHGYIALAGLALPLLFPWVDTPNVLLWYSAGALVLVAWRRVGWSPAVLVVIALALSANSWGYELGTSYEPLALLGLLALGSMLPRSSFGWAHRLPSWLSYVGRYPLTVYIGHIALLSLAVS